MSKELSIVEVKPVIILVINNRVCHIMVIRIHNNIFIFVNMNITYVLIDWEGGWIWVRGNEIMRVWFKWSEWFMLFKLINRFNHIDVVVQ